jgi:hypothetical protein
MTKTIHRSFRLTVREGMVAEQVKPHVRLVAVLFAMVLLLFALGSIALALAIVVLLALHEHEDWRAELFGVLVFLGIPIAIQAAAARILLTGLFVRLRWLTAEEAAEFTWMVHRWPRSSRKPSEKDN